MEGWLGPGAFGGAGSGSIAATCVGGRNTGGSTFQTCAIRHTRSNATAPSDAATPTRARGGSWPALAVIALLLALGVAPPLAALLLGRLHGRGGGAASPWRYAYALLVYVICIPGVGAAVVTGYTLFFTHENLLDKKIGRAHV